MRADRGVQEDARMEASYELRPLRVVVVGAGVAAIEVCLGLRALAGDRVELVLVAPEPEFELKPAAVGEPFGVAAVRRFDLGRVAADVDATLIRGTASAVEVDRRRLLVDGWHPVDYDAVVIAAGALATGAVPGAITFAGPRDVPVVRALLDELAGGGMSRLAVAIPAGNGWTLPAYELALLASAHLRLRDGSAPAIALVTPEPRPLEAFGARVSRDVAQLLAARDIEFHGDLTPTGVHGGVLHTAPPGGVRADRVIALPRLRGVRIDGLPVDSEGFVRTDRNCRVDALPDVYAAGDITDYPIKQGGIATQQADAVAEMIAADAGAHLNPEPFEAELRGLLLTGEDARFLSAAEPSSAEPEWWPPVKIPGRFLGPYLAALDSEQRLRTGTPAT
jgi:sulfide:quinone oxidoreductase